MARDSGVISDNNEESRTSGVLGDRFEEKVEISKKAMAFADKKCRKEQG